MSFTHWLVFRTPLFHFPDNIFSSRVPVLIYKEGENGFLQSFAVRKERKPQMPGKGFPGAPPPGMPPFMKGGPPPGGPPPGMSGGPPSGPCALTICKKYVIQL